MAGDALAAQRGVVRLGIGHPGCRRVASTAILVGGGVYTSWAGGDRNVGDRPHNGIWLAGVMARSASLTHHGGVVKLGCWLEGRGGMASRAISVGGMIGRCHRIVGRSGECHHARELAIVAGDACRYGDHCIGVLESPGFEAGGIGVANGAVVGGRHVGCHAALKFAHQGFRAQAIGGVQQRVGTIMAGHTGAGGLRMIKRCFGRRPRSDVWRVAVGARIGGGQMRATCRLAGDRNRVREVRAVMARHASSSGGGMERGGNRLPQRCAGVASRASGCGGGDVASCFVLQRAGGNRLRAIVTGVTGHVAHQAVFG